MLEHWNEESVVPHISFDLIRVPPVWVRVCAGLELSDFVSWLDGVRGAQTRLLVLHWYS